MGQSQSSVSILCISLKLTYSPENYQELFNLRHSSLRNAIERIFGILKNRFKILTQQLEFPFPVQVKLVKALCCLHNIIRLIGGDDVFDEEWDTGIANQILSDVSNNNNVSRRAITADKLVKLKQNEMR
jgi:Plant transposon protein.